MNVNERKILKCITSYDYAKLFNNKNTKIKLQKHPKLGIGLVSTKPIKKGETIAFYKFKVFSDKNFRGYKDSMYTMTVETKNGNPSRTLIGDIYSGSLESPTADNITFYAFFSNEPTPKQNMNAELFTELSMNYSDRKTVKPGDTMIYSLKATRAIAPKEPITWCYGDFYQRKYPVHPDCE